MPRTALIVDGMIIWRGWGILAILICGLAAGLGSAISVVNPALSPIFIGLMLIASIIGIAPGLVMRYVTPALEAGMRGALAFR